MNSRNKDKKETPGVEVHRNGEPDPLTKKDDGVGCMREKIVNERVRNIGDIESRVDGMKSFATE